MVKRSESAERPKCPFRTLCVIARKMLEKYPETYRPSEWEFYIERQTYADGFAWPTNAALDTAMNAVEAAGARLANYPKLAPWPEPETLPPPPPDLTIVPRRTTRDGLTKISDLPTPWTPLGGPSSTPSDESH